MIDVDGEKIEIFRKRIAEWGEENMRKFPWRETSSPYEILIAEIMLHRTRSNQVLDSYLKFISMYRSFEEICRAGADRIVSSLRALGLEWRARALHQMACEIAEKYNGKVPRSKDELKKLPGVGEYIASAFLCFAYGEKHPILDTNTVRILGRFFGLRVTDSSRRSERFMNIMRYVIEGENCRTFSYYLLDFGALVCKKSRPECEICPLKYMCEYRRQKTDGVKHNGT